MGLSLCTLLCGQHRLQQSQRYLGKDYPFENRYSETAVIARITPEKLTGEGPWAAKG